MNDRFKFRVWNKNTHSYTTGGAIKFGGLCFVDKEDFGIKLGEHQECYIIEQCTGVKDKNGNLIYEGDIIHEVDKDAEIDDLSQIVWNQSTCHFMKLDLPDTGLDRHCILCEDDSPYVEIIGNIHEQKEQQ